MKAVDAAGNVSAASASANATTLASDTTNPTVTLTAPAANAIIAGTVTLTATASDNVAVAGVQFLLDGNPLGAEDTTSPYSLTWNTASGALATTSGPHTLAARARDTSGNTATTTAINIVVDNVAPSGTVAINSNAAATNNATVTLTLSASDTQGAVTQMRFSNDGTTYSAAEAYATTQDMDPLGRRRHQDGLCAISRRRGQLVGGGDRHDCAGHHRADDFCALPRRSSHHPRSPSRGRPTNLRPHKSTTG